MFDFAILQGRYVKAAMDEIATFRPDGMTPVQVQTLIDTGSPVRVAYLAKLTAINSARASRRVGIEDLHQDCVDFTAQATSRYRKDPATVELLARLPVEDRTFQETLTRVDATAAVWEVLPDVGTPPVAFIVGKGTDDMELSTFLFKRDQITGVNESIPQIDTAFQEAEAVMHAKLAELDDFATAALALGRSRYEEGSVEREIIDAIPTEPAQQEPGQAVISSAAQAGSGRVHLAFDAPHGTSFAVLHRLAGSGVFATIAEDLIVKEFDATGLAAGQTHEFKVLPRNSRGTGPESDIASVPVT